MFHRLSAVLCYICLGIGFLGSFGSSLPVLSTAEENLGLHLLYQLRGVEKPQADVVVVAIDNKAAKALNLPAAPYKWPRTLHARLLERLLDEGAAVVAFDLIFNEPQLSANDRAFASAIRQAGNVILTQSIDRQTMPLVGYNDTAITQVTIEKMVSAIPILADAAIGQAPFPLPKIPIKLNQYWLFCSGAGDVPSLPIVVMHAFARDAFGEFLKLLKKVDPLAASTLSVTADGKNDVRHIIDAIRPLHILFEKKPALAGRMIAELDRHPRQPSTLQTDRLVRALIEIYRPGKSRYLNLYGPPRTIETISYHQLLDPADSVSTREGKALPPLKGKAVFVGQTESDWSKANDGFYTTFTETSGMDISGLEIAATAFANLLEGKTVHPLGVLAQFVVFMVWGSTTTLTSAYLSTPRAAAALVILNGFYLGLAHIQFKTSGIWFPLVIPVLVQTPAAFIAGLVWKYRRANKERQNIREAVGYYLPDEVIAQLTSNIKDIRAGGQILYSICLFTDAENYTPLSETMDPQGLTRLMNAYYEAIFKPIKANKGLVLQVVGDSVLALWTSPQPETELKSAACRAAVEIAEAVHQFNHPSNPYHLPTRIGIHAGEILLGNIGSRDHFEYRPVGDIVNTASRLEGLNKYLGTRLLTSEEAFGPDDGFLTRPVGRFIFKGKSHPVEVRELLPKNKLSRELQVAECRLFTSGWEAFKRRNWDEAEKTFNQVLKIDHNDGPSQFYLKLCQDFRRAPPGGDWDGSVHLKSK
jgi:adenylate cyclase